MVSVHGEGENHFLFSLTAEKRGGGWVGSAGTPSPGFSRRFFRNDEKSWFGSAEKVQRLGCQAGAVRACSSGATPS